MSLERLPAELQLEIFCHLANHDLKAARAVSRKLCENASPALFRSVVACARYQALGALQKISLNPVLPKYVKEIVFDGSLYNNDLARSAERYQAQSNKLSDIRVSSSFWGIREKYVAKALMTPTSADTATDGSDTKIYTLIRKKSIPAEYFCRL
jgi:hypothetical protein